MGYLIQLNREKKTNLHFRSIMKSFESMIDITKKVPSLMSLMFILSLIAHLGQKIIFIGHLNEI